jgi:hypothetical protein
MGAALLAVLAGVAGQPTHRAAESAATVATAAADDLAWG